MKECIWYNDGNYELLDFNPNGLSKKQVKQKAQKILKRKYQFDKRDMEKACETLYLIDIDNLERI